MRQEEYRLGMPILKIDPHGQVSFSGIDGLKVGPEGHTVVKGLDNTGGTTSVVLEPNHNWNETFATVLDRKKALVERTDVTVAAVQATQEAIAQAEQNPDAVIAYWKQRAVAFKPVDHFPLGTELWYVCSRSTVGSEILYGPLRSVSYTYPGTDNLLTDGSFGQYGRIQYENGYYPGLNIQSWFFPSEAEARAKAAELFTAQYPGTLDQSRVVVKPAPTRRVSL